MSCYRQNRLTGEWVIIAPERQYRPGHKSAATRPADAPRFDENCPFCPGNERMLEDIVAQWNSPEDPGWSQRAVPNRFPVVGDAPPSSREQHPARGRHEVIIETPRHDLHPGSMTPEALNTVLLAYQQRFRVLGELPGTRAVTLFRNAGAAGGASLAHPHAQLIALDRIAPRMAAIDQWLRSCHRKTGECAVCAMISRERDEGARIVAEDPFFATLVPSAPLTPFEQIIVPRVHQPSFGQASPGGICRLAFVLRAALDRLDVIFGRVPYNLVLENGPAEAEPGEGQHRHWYIRLVPRATTTGGFEMAAGMPIVPSLPEADARRLREATARPAQAEGKDS